MRSEMTMQHGAKRIHIVVQSVTDKGWQVCVCMHLRERHIAQKEKAESLVPRERFAANLDALVFVMLQMQSV